MFTYFQETGHAFSDCENFDDWAQEIALGREAWLTAWAKRIIPDHIWTKVKKEATRYIITRWMKDNGYRLVENKATMHWAIMHDDDVVSQYKVALQTPPPNCCRFCGEPLTMGSKTDVHGICTLKEHLEAAIAHRKTVVKA